MAVWTLMLRTCSLALLLAFSIQTVAGQNQARTSEADLRRAMQLVEGNKLLEAQPLLEQLHAANPGDPIVMEVLAFVLTAVGSIEQDNAKRKEIFLRARALAQRAQAAGRRTQATDFVLTTIPVDGDLPMINDTRETTPAEEALLAGNVAFAKSDMPAALEHFERAAKLDPTLYEAPLFIGDVYFRMKEIDKAGQYYAKAIALDPDRDTAYRYWGNVLLQNGKLAEARAKLIDAVIAQPYVRETWAFLTRWATEAGVTLVHPLIEIPKSQAPTKSRDGADAWMHYTASREAWSKDMNAFKQAYPGETAYRHSLQEEIVAFRLAAENVEGRLKSGELQEAALLPSISNLLMLHRAGLVESYILLALPDEGISQDYPEYRRQHRDKLRKYLEEYVTSER